jgi:hypothetical protein
MGKHGKRNAAAQAREKLLYRVRKVYRRRDEPVPTEGPSQSARAIPSAFGSNPHRH